ncbi:MAG: formyltransferase family protein [Campylobacterota bacterium]|nr:formyltransferase family protein [Campylobacterota bacterium]
MKKVAILSSHNGSGFEALYEASKNNILDINIDLIISNNSTAKVIDKAKSLNISNYIVNGKLFSNHDEKIVELLNKYKCDTIFLSGYMKKLSPIITNNFNIINSHPSLLPSYGGVGMYGRFVHEAVIKNQEKISGVTIHKVNENYDDGEIILQKTLRIDKNETAQTLENKIKLLEKEAIVEGFKCYLK